MRNTERGLKKSSKTRWLRGTVTPLFIKKTNMTNHRVTNTAPVPKQHNPLATPSLTGRPPIKRRPVALARGWLPADAGRRRGIRRSPDSPSTFHPRFTPSTSRWTSSQPPAGARLRATSQSWASCRGCWGDAPGASTVVRDCSSNSNSSSNE